MTGLRKAAAAVTIVLLSVTFLVGPSAGPSGAAVTQAPHGVAVTQASNGVAVTQASHGVAVTQAPHGVAAAQADTDTGGFGSHGDITDRYNIRVWDYQVDGLRARGPDIGQAVNNAPLGATAFVYWFAKFLVVALVWLLKFALDFGVATTLLAPVGELINVYQSFVGKLGLIPLALMLCVFWFGLVALRGRVGKGIGEITLSFVLVVALGAVLAAPGPMLLGDQGLLGRSRDVGATVAVLAVQDPTVTACRQVSPAEELRIEGCLPEELGESVPARHDPHVLRWILQTWLVDMYIRQPHQYIVYGQRLDCPLRLNVRRTGPDPAGDEEPCQPHPCLAQYNEILRTDPADLEGRGASTADPNSYMYDLMDPEGGGYDHDEECGEHGRELAAYNNSGDWGRVGLAAFLVLALVLLAVFIVAGVLLPLIVGQVMIAILTVALVFVLPVALLGGGGRQVLWRWFGLLLGALFMIIVALIGLSLMLITTDLLLRTTWHMAISMLLVCISSIVFLVIQRRLLKGGLAGGASIGAALGRVRVGGGAASGPAVAAGAAGTEGWSRPMDGGLNWATDRATFAGYRRNRRERADITRQLEHEDKVYAKHPEYARNRVASEEAARDVVYAERPEYTRRSVHREEAAREIWQKKRQKKQK